MKKLDGQLLLIPNTLCEVMINSQNDLSRLLDVADVIATLSISNAAKLVYINQLYYPKESKNLIHALSETLTVYDLMGESFTKLKQVEEGLAHKLLLEVEGLKSTMSEDDVRTMVEQQATDYNVKQFDSETVTLYVPELFVLKQNIFGVRMKAVVTDGTALAKNTVLSEASTTALGLLIQHFGNEAAAGTEVFNHFIRLTNV